MTSPLWGRMNVQRRYRYSGRILRIPASENSVLRWRWPIAISCAFSGCSKKGTDAPSAAEGWEGKERTMTRGSLAWSVTLGLLVAGSARADLHCAARDGQV